MSQASFERATLENEEETDDGVLIDSRVDARATLSDAMSRLQEMLARLNARPGKGIKVALIFDIVRAARAVKDARAALTQR